MTDPPQEPTAPNAQLRNRWQGFEWLSIILISGSALLLHIVFLTHAGGLWRDEAGYVRLATLPSWHEVWQTLPHDSAPLLFPALIRLWCKLGWGAGDFGLRILGFLCGLSLPAAFFVAARIMRRGTPFLALALVAVNVLVIRSGDSLRSYGLGSALNVLALALMWRAATEPGRATTFRAALVSVLSVQCLYQNAIFIFAAGCGGLVICIVSGRWRDGLRVLCVGLIAAASLLPYVGAVRRSQDWWLLEKMGFDFGMGWRNLATLMGSPFPHMAWLWLGLGLLALWLTARTVTNAAPAKAGDLVLFSAVGLLIGVIGFFVFLKSAQLPTQPWYFVPLLAFMAASLEALLGDLASRWVPAGATLAVLMAVAACVVSLPLVKCRQTNVDLVAKRLMTAAAPEDFILVHPWYDGVTFYRYYHGQTPWATVPPVADHDIHRYDEFKALMQEEHPIQPVIDQVLDTLRSGHRVWVVGSVDMSRDIPAEIRPAQNSPWGWSDNLYSDVWGKQAGTAIAQHALNCQTEPKVTEGLVNPDESVPVLVFSGWRESPAGQ